jgi:hypothetical protein
LNQIGARVPAGSLDPRDLLLTTADLPGAGWRQLDQRLWRTGKSGGTEWERIARESKSVAGWRSFEQREAQRWIWAQATSLPSPEVAAAAFSDAPNRMLANLGAEVAVVRSVESAPPEIPGSTAVWAMEHETAGPRGASQAFYLAWTVENVLSAAAWSALRDGWTWTGIAQLASVQAKRIVSALGRENHSQ